MRGCAGRRGQMSPADACAADRFKVRLPARPLILPLAARAGPSFSHKGRRDLLVTAALVLSCLAPRAFAQDTPAVPAPDSAAPTSSSAPSAGAAPEPIPAPVQVQTLAKLDLFSTGRETGLGQDLWKGTSADIARAVIPTLASRPLSPAGLDLARQVLAQAATAPDGAGADADLAAARAKALLALGEAGLADTILGHTPGLSDNAALSQTAAEAALITGQDAKACAISDALAQGREAIYWLRLRTYCLLINGKTDAAQLTFTLAVQQGKDPVFSRLMGVAINGAGDPGRASLRNGLDYALSRRLKLDLGQALESAPPAIAEAIAAASAQAAAAGAPAAPTSLSEPEVIAPLQAVRSYPAFVAAAKAAEPGLAALVQAKSPMTEPVLEISAALAAGDVATAQAIRDGLSAGGAPSLNPDDLAILDAALAAGAGKPDAAALDALCVRGGSADAKARGRLQTAALLLAALGGDISDADRADLIGFEIGRVEAPAARLLILQDAAASGRVGETALIALTLAQAGGTTGPATADRVQIIRALSRVGLKSGAQAFALEGLSPLLPR